MNSVFMAMATLRHCLRRASIIRCGFAGKLVPFAIGPERDVHIPARPVVRRARGVDVAAAIGGATERHSTIPVEDRELDKPIEKSPRRHRSNRNRPSGSRRPDSRGRNAA